MKELVKQYRPGLAGIFRLYAALDQSTNTTKGKMTTMNLKEWQVPLAPAPA